MPVFHDPDRLLLDNRHRSKNEQTPHPPATIMRKPSEESIRTEFCDGPEPDPPDWITMLEDKAASMATKEEENRTSDRAELIERIKRGESPTWVPSQTLEQECLKEDSKRSPSPTRNIMRMKEPLRLLPAAEISQSRQGSHSPPRASLSPQEEIQRPKSALHSGNFTEGSDEPRLQLEIPSRDLKRSEHLSEGPLGTSPTTPWYAPGRRWPQPGTSEGASGNEREPEWMYRRPSRSRAPSLQSYSSSYVLKAPTTPLVQQSNSTDFDLSPVSPMDLSESPTKANRRHTLPPYALSTSAIDDMSSSQSTYQPLSSRLDDRLPHQRHRPRRSLTSTWSLQMAPSPQSPRQPGSRRQSLSSETASLHRASMVGSYEESILRGRMSTAPSKPLDFTAQIGVLGKDNCKPKCPAHVTVPFPAVFYSYNSSGDQIVGDEPSPYVGQIDLEQLLPPAEIEKTGRKRRHSPNMRERSNSHASNERLQDQQDEIEGSLQVRKRKKRREASPPPEAPPGGSYRIPQKGQLQIIIKNPNKTAVKLFLIPYDLTGMEAGTKTFIRQRSYCSGTTIETAIRSSSEDPSGPLTAQEQNKRPTLRYLIHVNICSPSKGRFYLYHHIRVVFANRVPDNKEQLQNDIQLPDPRFSVYKPTRESLTPRSSLGAQLTAEKAYRRRSAGFGSESDAIGTRYAQSLSGEYPHGISTPTPPVPPIPFDLAMPRPRPSVTSPMSDAETSRPTTSTDSQSPLSDKKGHFRSHGFGSLRSISSSGSDSYTKLSKEDASNGGVYGRPGTPEPGEGLLARKLRGLGFPRGLGPEEDR
ncbi:hypothetical protein G7Y79_00013g035530 [Physcia stellaris]|nr:hypothetical protein G7Y79_00013g035530 [Physcia stellaris]